MRLKLILKRQAVTKTMTLMIQPMNKTAKEIVMRVMTIMTQISL